MRKFLSFSANVFLIIILLFVTLTIGELYFRLFNPQPIVPRYSESASYGIRKNIANVRGEMITSEYRHKFSTNSHGFRGLREYSVKKPSGIYRVVVLGDSVALGHGVNDEETFSALLENRISQLRPSEIINMAVSGFGSAEELIQLNNIGFKYSPDLIILAYFANDPYNNAVSNLFKLKNGILVRNKKSFVPAIFIRDTLYKIPGYSFLCQRSHFLNFLRRLFSSYFIKKLGKANKFSSVVQSELMPEHKILTAALINRIIATSNKHRIPIIILNVPSLVKGDVSDNLPRELLKFDKNVHLIDIEGQICNISSLESLYYKKDCHLKPLGHRLIAEFLTVFIRDKIWA